MTTPHKLLFAVLFSGLIAMAAASITAYAGSPWVMVIFHAAFLALVALIFPRPRLYVYTFFAGFLFLGFWPKLVAHLIWSVDLLEPVGNFSGSTTQWDTALTAAACGALGVILVRSIHLLRCRRAAAAETGLPRTGSAPWWFIAARRPIWMLTIAGVVILNAINMQLAIFQVGVNPLLVMRFHMNVPFAWLINIGFAAWIATLVHWDYQIDGKSLKRNLLLPVVEAFMASMSSLSRLAFLLHAGPYFVALAERWADFSKVLNRRYLQMLAAGCAALLCTTILLVFLLRIFTFHDYEQYVGKRNALPGDPPAAMTLGFYLGEVLTRQIPKIVIQRWTGLEGVLTASAAPDTGRTLLLDIIQDDPVKGADSLYQRHARPSYLAAESGKFTFLSNSGVMALFLFSGSALLVLAGMALVMTVLAATEMAARALTGNPFFLAVIGAGLANVASQTTFPYLSMIYLLQIWVAIAFIWLITRIPGPAGLPVNPGVANDPPIYAWLQNKLPNPFTPSARAGRNALLLLCISLAAMAFVSLNPYFMWAHQKIYYAAATGLLVLSLPFCRHLLSFSRERIGLMLGFALFLVYLSLLPKTGGGVTRWFLLIPFTVCLLALHTAELKKAFGMLYWLFAVSLIPGMLLWLWTAAGLPVEFAWMTPPTETVQRGVTEYFMIPGAVVLPSNAQMLPHGGIIFRLCGIYDEPGTVGTVAALFLAATRFRLRDPRGAIAFTAGLMSFSVAFSILVGIGMLATAAMQRKWVLLPAALIAASVGGVASGLIPMSYEVTKKPAISVIDNQAGGSAPVVKSGSDLDQYGLQNEARLRFSRVFNNRAQPKMRELFNTYRQSPAGTLLFGVASDASNQTGGSAIWYMILTNFGAVGFLWLFLLFFTPLLLLWRSGGLTPAVILFTLLFLMSFYQRPVIWLPAQIMIYIAGVFCFRSSPRVT